MFRNIFTAAVLALCATGAAIAEESEKISVMLKGITIVSPGFTPQNIRVTDPGVISAEIIADQQLRITGINVGKSDLHITAGNLSKLYTVTVNDNIREIFNAVRKDLDSVPEVDISINRERIVLKGEVSSLDGWDTINRVLPQYGSTILNLAFFRPAPEVMVALKKTFEKAGYEICQESELDEPGKLSLTQSGNTLILHGTVYCEDEIKAIRQIISTQSWISVDPKETTNRVKLVEKLAVKPVLLDVGTVFVGIRSAETSRVGSNLLANGIRIGQGFDFSTLFRGGTNQSYNLNANLTSILNLMAESGCSRYHRAGHLSFMSNDSNDYKSFHEGGTIKVRITSTMGTGSLQDIPYGFIMRVRGGLLGKDRVRLDLSLEVSTPIPQENGDYDVKQSKVDTTIVCRLGETVALAGMKEITEGTAGPSGIPFLRKVPVLNWICAEKNDSFNDSQILILVYPQVAGKTPPLQMPPSAETADTLKESERSNRERSQEKTDNEKSFWRRWF